MTQDLPRLPRYGDLTIRGTTLADLAPVLTRHLGTNWSRADETEAAWAEREIGADRPAVFRHDSSGPLPGALVFLFEQSADVLWVSNIVPTEAGQLSESEYNGLLLDFHDSGVAAAVRELGADVVVDVTDYILQERAGPDVQDALLRFSRAANRSTGASHPLDAERFDDFVIAASRLTSDRRPSGGIIAEWLVADGWPEDIAYDLAVQYERGLRLLDRSSSHG